VRIKDSAKKQVLPANSGGGAGNGGLAKITQPEADRFPGASFVMAALQPAAIDQNALHVRNGKCTWERILEPTLFDLLPKSGCGIRRLSGFYVLDQRKKRSYRAP